MCAMKEDKGSIPCRSLFYNLLNVCGEVKSKRHKLPDEIYELTYVGI